MIRFPNTTLDGEEVDNGVVAGPSTVALGWKGRRTVVGFVTFDPFIHFTRVDDETRLSLRAYTVFHRHHSPMITHPAPSFIAVSND